MNLHGWLPARVAWRETGPRVEWILMGRRRLLEPFFEQSLGREMTHPFHHLFRRDTSPGEMAAWTQAHPPAPLRGIIFHMSRCGSTLISQQLAALECNIVASEPAPLDAILRARQLIPDLPRDVHVTWLRAMVAALGQPRAEEQALYIKADCWHVHQIDLIREAFPEVPWIFLYRDPIEVMVSLQRMPATWTIPGLLHPLALQLELKDWNPTQTDVYTARALACICEAALKAMRHDPHGLLVNYSELPQAMYERLRLHFALPAAQIPAMERKATQNAKSPQIPFVRDEQAKHAAATERLRAVVAAHLQGVYIRLEAGRRMQASRRLGPVP
ncbi:MAG: sulfotransferase family protein [Steroidobacteraceae bacterium]